MHYHPQTMGLQKGMTYLAVFLNLSVFNILHLEGTQRNEAFHPRSCRKCVVSKINKARVYVQSQSLRKVTRTGCNQQYITAIAKRLQCELNMTSICTEGSGSFKGRMRGEHVEFRGAQQSQKGKNHKKGRGTLFHVKHTWVC